MGTRVAVLGSGPAGLMAAHAAAMSGIEQIHIYSPGGKSVLHGAQYLHRPIPMITHGQGEPVQYRLLGTADGYRDKVYGPKMDVQVSPETLEGNHLAWDLRRAYEGLWLAYGSYVIDSEIKPGDLAEMAGWYDLVVSTIPAPLLCLAGHRFQSQLVWVGNQYMSTYGGNSVVCNGERSPAWYRTSSVFGITQTEWPATAKPPVPVVQVEKPVMTNCNCLPQVLRVGRYGTWTKGVLAHDGYEKTRRQCHEISVNSRAL